MYKCNFVSRIPFSFGFYVKENIWSAYKSSYMYVPFPLSKRMYISIQPSDMRVPASFFDNILGQSKLCDVIRLGNLYLWKLCLLLIKQLDLSTSFTTNCQHAIAFTKTEILVKSVESIRDICRNSNSCFIGRIPLPLQSLVLICLKSSGCHNMSRVVRNPAFCICESKDADQLRGNHVADQRLCFRYIDSAIPLLPIYEISSL